MSGKEYVNGGDLKDMEIDLGLSLFERIEKLEQGAVAVNVELDELQNYKSTFISACNGYDKRLNISPVEALVITFMKKCKAAHWSDQVGGELILKIKKRELVFKQLCSIDHKQHEDKEFNEELKKKKLALREEIKGLKEQLLEIFSAWYVKEFFRALPGAVKKYARFKEMYGKLE